MGCKGICSNHEVKSPYLIHSGRYELGQKRCSVFCVLFCFALVFSSLNFFKLNLIKVVCVSIVSNSYDNNCNKTKKFVLLQFSSDT